MIGYYLTLAVVVVALVATLTTPIWMPIAERRGWIEALRDEWDRPIPDDAIDDYIDRGMP